MERKLTYLAVPYSHERKDIREYRFDMANRAAAKLFKEGKLVFSPISHSHPMTEYGLPEGFEAYMEFDKAILEISRELVVLKLEGWSSSKGVSAEIGIAVKLGIPITYMTLQELFEDEKTELLDLEGYDA